jgi:thioredoxin-dependent peroxiredoxin
MKVANNQSAPDFSVADVYGNTISLHQFKGQKIHLVFYRFSGCPFCNLRFHQIEKLAEQYKKAHVKLISIYESKPENMKAQMADEKFYSIMIPNADSSLYKLYELDKSKWGLLVYLLFKGGLFAAIKGNKLYKKKVAIDGPTDRIGAEFLIDENGNVVNAYYGKTPGDYLPIDTVKKFIGA